MVGEDFTVVVEEVTTNRTEPFCKAKRDAKAPRFFCALCEMRAEDANCHGSLQNSDDVIQPKPVLPDSVVRQRSLAQSFGLVN